VTAQGQRGAVIDIQLQAQLSLDSISQLVFDNTGIPGTFLGLRYDAAVYRIIYYTLSTDGSLTRATGLITRPTNYGCSLALMTYGHGLSLKDDQVPTGPTSGYRLIATTLASDGFLGVAPDYIFIGAEADSGFQAFMDAKTEAAATIDLMRAARQVAADSGWALSGQVFLSGYSQGGHSSMATARELQTNHTGEFTVTAVSSGGGSFDLSGIAGDSLASSTRPTPEPHAMCLVARSYITHYQDSIIALTGQPLDWISVFRSPYAETLDTMLRRDTPLYDVSRLDSVPNRMLQDSFRLDFQTNPAALMRTLLSYNDLYDWVPQMPLRMYHSDADIENPYDNVLFTLAQFQAGGAPDVSIVVTGSQSHPEAAIPHLLQTRTWFMDLRTPCTPDSRTEPRAMDLQLYPNPAPTAFSLQWTQPGAQRVDIVDASGRVVHSEMLSNTTTLWTHHWPDANPSGPYWVLLRTQDAVWARPVLRP
jgi:hypothetical protein